MYKSYSANYWKVIQEFFQILGFTGIDDKHTLSSDIVSESFIWFCKRFIEIQNQSLLFFSFKSYVKETSNLHLAIKTINELLTIGVGIPLKVIKKE